MLYMLCAILCYECYLSILILALYNCVMYHIRSGHLTVILNNLELFLLLVLDEEIGVYFST